MTGLNCSHGDDLDTHRRRVVRRVRVCTLFGEKRVREQDMAREIFGAGRASERAGRNRGVEGTVHGLLRRRRYIRVP